MVTFQWCHTHLSLCLNEEKETVSKECSLGMLSGMFLLQKEQLLHLNAVVCIALWVEQLNVYIHTMIFYSFSLLISNSKLNFLYCHSSLCKGYNLNVTVQIGKKTTNDSHVMAYCNERKTNFCKQ